MIFSLARLEKIDLETVWKSERGFTTWLAQDDNIQLLGEAINLQLDVEAQEKNIGPFRADLLCKDILNKEHWILIENQIQVTDHKHLGQLLTYAAGLNAVTIVWISRIFSEEHRAALDWLNEITDERFNFFGLEIELWRIGNSPVAPKFNIVSKPNGWAKTVTIAANRMQSKNLTDTQKLQLTYWNDFSKYLLEQKSKMKSQKPRPENSMPFKIGRYGFSLSASINTRDKRISVALIIGGGGVLPNSKTFYYLLQKEKDEIETELEMPLQWLELPERKESRLEVGLDANPMDQTEWLNQHIWIKENLEAFHKVLSKRIKVLNADDMG